MNLDGLLKEAVSRGLIGEAEREAAIASISTAGTGEETPWYLHVLIGVGAWIASIFLIGFMAVIAGGFLTRSAFVAIVAGLILTGAACLVRRLNLGIFASQLCLSFSLTGQATVLMGVSTFGGFNSFGPLVIAALLLAALLYIPFPDRTHRFLTCTVALSMAAAWLLYHRFLTCTAALSIASGSLLQNGASFLVPATVIAHLAGLAFIFANPRSSPILRPLGYALTVSLAVLFLPIGPQAGYSTYWGAMISFWTVKLALGTSLLCLSAWAMGGWKEATAPARRHTLLLISAGALILTYLSSGGILVALGLLVLGYGVQNRVLMCFGAVLLPTFVSTYYYWMQITLLRKSVLLMVSGAVLLAIWAILVRTRSNPEAIQ